MQYTGALFYTLDKTYISYVECNGNTFITPSNAEYMICQFWFESNPMNYKDIIQIEENSVATSFQKFNGAITHNGDAPVVFAESERQKSKNLLNLTRPAITSNVKAYNDHIIINGTVEGYVYPYFSSNLPQGVQLKQGNTYTFSRTLLRGTGNNSFKIDVSLRNINDTEIQIVTIPDGEDSVTFTIGSNDIAMYACSLLFTSSATFTDAYYGLQIEEGSVATDYQPYNGAIVHEKEIADVEHIETIYDMSSSDGNINWGYTSGIIFKTQTISDKNFTKYKRLRVYCDWNEHANNWFGATTHFDVELDNDLCDVDGNFVGYLAMTPSNAYINEINFIFYGKVLVRMDKLAININGYLINIINNTRTELTDTANYPHFKIMKIEGVY